MERRQGSSKTSMLGLSFVIIKCRFPSAAAAEKPFRPVSRYLAAPCP
ncbi:hypothetical protein B4098_0949 [Heyndrickxia coagulans]|uniref:Uncharacterized protein n=1 Tax=Heyndrickxia coagulans TaxID=1398 RepID=A0A150K9V0_HEYCO|nr:hypothetical protein B4098_0949 [Heyndrickxia coagulans]KYC66342.1 hypothetical protein B4100_1068 [Heyndrickxia coagulans]